MNTTLTGGSVPALPLPPIPMAPPPPAPGGLIPIRLGLTPEHLENLQRWQAGKRDKRATYSVKRAVNDLAAAIAGTPRTVRNAHAAVIWLKPHDHAAVSYLGSKSDWSDAMYAAIWNRIEPSLYPAG